MKSIFFLITLALHVEANDINSLLYNGNCITCHKATKSIAAPSMLEIQRVYKNAFSEKDDFINYMSTWVQNPSEDASLMSSAIKKYGLMPHLSFDEYTLKDISTHIYETDFSKNTGRYWTK